MNDFGDTPQQQPEGFCIITNQLHTNDFSVAAEKDDNDDDDSIFEFAPVQTAYEKSQSAATAAATAASSSQEFNMYNHPSNTNNPRKVRAFGLSASRRTHGTTGSSSSSNFRFPRSIPSTPTTARNATLFGGFGAGGGTVVARETGALNDPDWALDPTDAGGALADESSPEFVRPPPRMSHTHNHHSQSCSSFMNHPEFQTRSSDNHKNVETEIVEEEPLDDCRRRPLFQRNRNPTTMTTTNHSSRSSSARSSPINTGGGGCFHSRGGSSMALLTKSTSTALFPRPSNTRNGSRRVFQRSHSLALGSNHRTFQNNNHAMNAASVPNLNYTDSSCPQQMWMLGQDDDEWEENCHPNSNNRYMNAKTHTNHTIYPLDDDAVERSFFPTGDGGGGEAPNHHHPYSKKSRSSRRHSIATASRSAIFGDCDRTMSCTSSSSLSSSATSLQLLPPDLQWLGSSSNSTTTTSAAAPEMGGMEQHFSSSSESALATTGGLSSKKGRSLSILQSPIIEGGRTSSHGNNSEDRSAASSSNRKRGVCGSPISDYGGDDFFQDRLTLSSSSLSVDARRRRARSRVFLPEPDVCWPPLPCLAAPRRGDAAAAMELEDNSDDEEGGKELSMNQSSSSTPESSFEAAGTAAVVRRREPSLIPPDDEESKIRSIIDHLPCLDDLEFLIGELRRERDRRQKNIDRGGSSFVFGSKEAWKFVTQGPLWTGHRRAAFMTWARTHLGFAIRSAGMGYTYIQISHSKGAPLLDMLEATKSVYENEQRVNNGTKVEDEPSATLSLFPCPSTQHPALPLGVIDSNAVCPLPILKPHTAAYPSCSDADDLVRKISSLTLAPGRISSGSEAMIRQVTLPPEEEHERDIRGLPSMDNGIKCPAFSRSSIEGGAFSMDPGNSPHARLGRPPRMSTGSSVCSTETGCKLRLGGRTGTPCLDEQASSVFNFVTTPSTNKDRTWGSQPVAGKDWGASLCYDTDLLAELLSRFKTFSCSQGSHSSFGSLTQLDELPELPQRSQSLFFEHTADSQDNENTTEEKEVSRKNRKRMNNASKRNRISLFAAATGAKASLLSKQCHVMTLHDERNVVEEKTSDALSTGRLLLASERAITERLLSASEKPISHIFSFLNASDLMTKVLPVCKNWADWSSNAHANMLKCSASSMNPEQPSMMSQKSWNSIHKLFPWARFLAEGGFKKVYRVFNASVGMDEAVAVMDMYGLDNYQVLANELAILSMMSSLVRRGICPNFVAFRGFFTGAHSPPKSHWGDESMKCPNGRNYGERTIKTSPSQPQNPYPGRFQYIRMELANEGDVEELIKRQPDECFSVCVARGLLFQIAFALYAAADKFSTKHYDIKLLNVFVEKVETDRNLLLRYGLGSHVFTVDMPATQSFIAKLADFGTADASPESNGLPVTIAHITTLENTPADYLILGDNATQGHGHDSFGLGLCMLQLFSGSRPYEEILADVLCPPNLKKYLEAIWEDESIDGYSVIRTVILEDVEKDDDGNIVEGEPDQTFYDTLYRFLVLFGIPKVKFQQKTAPRVWKAICDALESTTSTKTRGGKPARKKSGSDVTRFNRDCKKFSIISGNNPLIARARNALLSIDGGLDLLLSLCDFNPNTRASAMDVLNCTFMAALREEPGTSYLEDNPQVRSYMYFATQN